MWCNFGYLDSFWGYKWFVTDRALLSVVMMAMVVAAGVTIIITVTRRRVAARTVNAAITVSAPMQRGQHTLCVCFFLIFLDRA
jgi:hypothetical protein